MYWLLGMDTVLRITATIVFLFVVVPFLAWKRPRSFGRLEWFWWCLGAGMIALTLAGQTLTLLNIAATPTYAILIVTTIVVLRARRHGTSPLAFIRDLYRVTVLSALNVLEGRASVRRRVKRTIRTTRRRLEALLAPPRVRWALGGWIAIITAAAVTRLYRPFATANLGFSDTYVHLYLMRLLDEGRQIDPAWGPYPRGMHFLLLAIERLTNPDPVMLINFFGSIVGILITLAVADVARRSSGSTTAAVVAGLAFATMVGGPSQYFLLGGSVATDNASLAREVLARSYDQLADAGEFDVLLTVFQRQCATLPQELATVLLFPAAFFLYEWLRRKEDRGYRLAGFALCTAAIAAVHSGVLIPLVLLCAVSAILAATRSTVRDIARAAALGAASVAVGCSWMLGYIRYASTSTSPHTESTALYYFPFLRRFGDGPVETTYMMITPFLSAMVIVAIAVVFLALRFPLPAADSPRWGEGQGEGSVLARGTSPHPSLRSPLSPQAGRGKTAWIALVFLTFFLIHASGTLQLPELVESRRSAIWLAMSIAALLGVAASALAVLAARMVAVPQRRRVAVAIPVIAVAAWLFTVPALFAAPMRQKIVDYSGYGTTALAVVKISRSFEPFSWTLVSYGQEFPMVLGRGFHLPAADFLGQYDPAEATLRIPTRYVFIAVEKRPHRFQINNWAVRFDRNALEERLQTWCSLYNLTHRNMRIYLDDDNVRVYVIEKRG